jgi:hypothetical protein
MRKLLLGAAMLLFAQMGFGQAVSDQAVVPVSVTLNSILRLTVTSGGNIVFVVNTIDQYTNGITSSARTTTSFRVSSSRDFTVTMTTENATHFVGLETGSVNQFLNGNIGYTLTGQGIFDAVLQELTGSEVIVDAGLAGGNKPYTIAWELATSGAGRLLETSGLDDLLTQSLPADIYVNNIFLTLAN